MNPRSSVDPEAVNEWGLPDPSGLAPRIGAARQRLRQVAYRMRTVDPVTTELVRIRNARYQNCVF